MVAHFASLPATASHLMAATWACSVGLPLQLTVAQLLCAPQLLMLVQAVRFLVAVVYPAPETLGP